MIDLGDLSQYSRIMLCMIYGGAYIVVFTSHSSFIEVMEGVKDKLGKPGSHFSIQSASYVSEEIVEYMKENSGSKYMIDLGED